MGAYAWYYNDHSNDISYWAFSNEYSTSEFARQVSRIVGKTIYASDTSYATGSADLERHQRGMKTVHI